MKERIALNIMEHLQQQQSRVKEEETNNAPNFHS